MILEAVIDGNCAVVYTKAIYQYERNVTLNISGIELPEKYVAYFSNQKDFGISVMRKGSTYDGVQIPNALLVVGDYVYVWVFSSDADGIRQETLCNVVVPVIRRAIPISYTDDEDHGGASETVNYEIEADDENLIFKGALNNIITKDIEEEET